MRAARALQWSEASHSPWRRSEAAGKTTAKQNLKGTKTVLYKRPKTNKAERTSHDLALRVRAGRRAPDPLHKKLLWKSNFFLFLKILPTSRYNFGYFVFSPFKATRHRVSDPFLGFSSRLYRLIVLVKVFGVFLFSFHFVFEIYFKNFISSPPP